MTKDIKHIGLFTSGGDAPGMNAALYAVVKAASANGIKVSGIRKGFEGLIDNDFVELKTKQLQKTMHLGGTVLKTARSERFRTAEGREVALQNIHDNKIDGLIAIGGDGTFRGISLLSQISDIPCIGIPGTIDNDTVGTDFTLGFDSAVNTAMNCIDNIRDTAESHNRMFVIEVMGRDSGYIGVFSGLTSGADSILIPESPQDMTYLLDKIQGYESEDAFIVVLSEGNELSIDRVSQQIRQVNDSIDLRVCKLGHIQRGGNPTAADRMLGIRLGVVAVNALIQGESNQMAGICNNQPVLTPFSEIAKQHTIDSEQQRLVDLFCR
ncbi:6-phosphofructokinase [Paraglaciecola sp. T6c]|uniref:ATP-dependent 6-phosphofructokinase n=1 Tax=Pseudoalteromonas atlantica (strain T6c / ATCC BAA-1087) TaxID=3042615 RepID=UPI00005C5440|nr:ATP-dependent 6-phosphofructokinase [Paraglaciecola sp. T6c]ABG41107.1 6-phosphofructokinase [Paraglaciecola sp. T6c]